MKFHKNHYKWNTFLDLRNDEKNFLNSSVILIPIPYDGTASYKSGARHGPSAIINASS